MGLGKTYSADYLIDSNGNTGVSGQVLISTATGIDWADGYCNYRWTLLAVSWWYDEW